MTYVFKNVYLIDCTGAQPVENAVVVVKGNKIFHVGKDVPTPKDAAVFDLAGCSLLPGLIDSHVHAGADTIANFRRADDSGDYASMRERLRKTGVTAVRTCGDCRDDILALREKIRSRSAEGPRIYTCGGSFQAKNGHPNSTVWHSDPRIVATAAFCPESENEARLMVREQIDAGVDYIKIIWSDFNPFSLTEKNPKLSSEIVAAIIDEARSNGKPVGVHCENAADALFCVKAGATAIEHLVLPGREQFDVYDELFPLMIDKGVYLTLTATVSLPHSRGMKPSDPGSPLYAAEVFKKAIKSGVKVCVGTDALEHGDALITEMEYYVNTLGCSEMYTLTAATKTNSELLEMADEIGTIEEGKLADILVVGGNPLENISDLRNVRLVMQDGHIVYDNIV